MLYNIVVRQPQKLSSNIVIVVVRTPYIKYIRSYRCFIHYILHTCTTINTVHIVCCHVEDSEFLPIAIGR